MQKKYITHKFQQFIRFILACALTSLVCTHEPALASSNNMEGIQIYQKNLPSLPEHKQKLVDDIKRYRNADNLWDVLREEFVLPHYEDNPLVQEKIEWFMNNQDFLLRSASRAAPYLYYILQQVRKRHLPAELVLLPIIESGYNPFSLSPMGAAGVWQLMPSTATGLGVRQDWWYDGRRDVITSTRAALNYLAYLQSFFEGNWLYAIAAYNTGEGNVLSAIKRNIRDGRSTNFWSLPVAHETQDYVPSLLALAIIISNPDQYPIYFPPVRNAPYLAQVDVGTQIGLKYAGTLAGLSYKKIMQLNPGFNRSVTSSKGPYKLVLPIENVEQFTENLSRTPLSKQINWIHYKVKTGDTIASVAKKFKTSIVAIQDLNRLKKSSLKHGTSILIPKNEIATAETIEPTRTKSKIISYSSQNNAEIIATANSMSSSFRTYTLKPGDTIYMVRDNDNFESIARRFKISSQELRMANKITSSQLKSGKQIIIPTHITTNNETTQYTSNNKKLEPGDTIYMVRRGDTIDKIARKFNTSASAIRLANLVDDNSLMEGERLVVPTHLRG